MLEALLKGLLLYAVIAIVGRMIERRAGAWKDVPPESEDEV